MERLQLAGPHIRSSEHTISDQDVLEIFREVILSLRDRSAANAAGGGRVLEIHTSGPSTQSAPSADDTGSQEQTASDVGLDLPNRLMTVVEVAEFLGVTRSTVDQMPIAVLPFADVSPTHKRQHKRFDPRDVAALPARLRAWNEARQRGEGEKFLAEAGRALRERDAQAMRRATEWEVAA